MKLVYNDDWKFCGFIYDDYLEDRLIEADWRIFNTFADACAHYQEYARGYMEDNYGELPPLIEMPPFTITHF